ncbi:plasminogen-like [Mercenaria mercenaria]|uniref:plasminogen-like n=1 Tax=Mercenaria mercenaria TaxID=6596 RepID=UPI00234FA471|nr:plasminogen-like [Mercenaria mercenaria]
MNFQFYHQDNTWESESCETGLAEYFICEITFETYKNNGEPKPRFSKFSSDWDTFPDQQIKTTEYTGMVNVSDVNTPCLYWANVTKDSLKQNEMWWQKFFPENEESNDDESGLYIYRDYSQGRKYAHNYCRDPMNDGYLGCYTTNGYSPCTFVLPAAPHSATSYYYRGKQNTTYSGKTCQHWNIDVPQVQEVIEYDYKGESLKDKGNYCRDIWDTGYIWCYTTDIDTRWEPCIVKDSSSGRCSQIVESYSRTLNVTFSGKPCKHWNTYIAGKDMSASIKVLDNYCRDPFDEGFLWCYTDLANLKREPCFDLDEHINEDKKTGSLDSRENYTCANGDLINFDNLCNRKIDCVDLSDEMECYENNKKMEFCGIKEYKCSSGQCISAENRCDAYVHCLDGSDEQFCNTCNEDKAFHCDIVRCIPNRLVCDKYADCVDRSDETSCMERTYPSCEHWWNIGFRETGPYVISGIDVICDFDSVFEKHVIYTIFNNIDIIWYDETRTGNMYVRESKRESDASFVEAFATGNCTQEIKQSCDPVHKSIQSFNDEHFIDDIKECTCAIQTITKPTDV